MARTAHFLTVSLIAHNTPRKTIPASRYQRGADVSTYVTPRIVHGTTVQAQLKQSASDRTSFCPLRLAPLTRLLALLDHVVLLRIVMLVVLADGFGLVGDGGKALQCERALAEILLLARHVK